MTPPERVHAMNLLLADDSDDSRMLFRAYLRETTHQLDEAHDGQQALDLFAKKRYDVIFMDMQMPLMDGATAVMRMRDMEKEGRAPAGKPSLIVALSAHNTAEEIQKAINAGCDSHLAKPLRKAVLIEFLNNASAGRFKT